MGTPDLTLQECCERWGISSRNSVKSRAAALGVALRRESSTRTVWPREDVPLGDELHEHLQGGGTLRDFPGALPQQSKPAPITTAPAASLAAVGGSSDAIALALLQLLQQQTPAPSAGPLARARAMAAAADERLPLTTPELAEVVGLDQEELAGLKAGTVLYGFRLDRIGTRPTKPKANKDAKDEPTTPAKPKPDRRAWLLVRVTEASDDQPETVTAVSALPPVTARKRAPGFVACFDAEVEVLDRLQLPSW
jgi:hypothetical protein